MPGRRALLTSAISGSALSMVSRSSSQPAVAATGVVPFAVDVREFGATGDGLTDDTSALQRAIDAAAGPNGEGGRVHVPPGRYRVTRSLVADHGTTLVGANPAASALVLDDTATTDLLVGGSRFPVYLNLRDLTLDGGLSTANTPNRLPTGTGSARVRDKVRKGQFVSMLTISDSTCSIGPGDVLRAAGQPAVVVNDGVERAAGFSGRINVCHWAPEQDVSGVDEWRVYRTGSLVRGFGRLGVDNCFLQGARRHAIELVSATQGNLSNCEIGNNQGCGVFSWSSTDYTFSGTWCYRNGGPDIYTYAAADVRVHDCILEGSGSYSVYADWGEVDVADSGLWGARCGLIRTEQCGSVRLRGLKLRSPGFGAHDGSTVGSPGFSALSARPSIFVAFSAPRFGAHVSQCALGEARAATGPMVWIENGGRSNLSGLEWDPDVTFSGGDAPSRIIRDGGVDTIIRGCRGVPDEN